MTQGAVFNLSVSVHSDLINLVYSVSLRMIRRSISEGTSFFGIERADLSLILIAKDPKLGDEHKLMLRHSVSEKTIEIQATSFGITPKVLTYPIKLCSLRRVS